MLPPFCPDFSNRKTSNCDFITTYEDCNQNLLMTFNSNRKHSIEFNYPFAFLEENNSLFLNAGSNFKSNQKNSMDEKEFQLIFDNSLKFDDKDFDIITDIILENQNSSNSESIDSPKNSTLEEGYEFCEGKDDIIDQFLDCN
jgi:hypothetical protein